MSDNMKNKSAISIGLLLFLSLAPGLTSANIAGYPTSHFYVTYNGNKIPDANFSATLFTCGVNDTFYSQIVERYKRYGIKIINPILNVLNTSDYDPEGKCYWRPSDEYLHLENGYTYCKNSECFFMTGFGYPKTKFVAYVPSLDKVFITETFSKTEWSNIYVYKVELDDRGNGKVYEIKNLEILESNPFIITYILTLIIELVVSFIFLSIAKMPKEIMLAVLAANVISYPIFYFLAIPLFTGLLLSLLNINSTYTSLAYYSGLYSGLLISEIFVVIFEAFFIHYFNKQTMTLKKSFMLSILMNLVSAIIGIIALPLIMTEYIFAFL